MNEIDFDVALEILHHEAVVRQTYFDSVGVATWSVGITSASGHRVERYIDNPQPMEYCLEVFVWVLRRYADSVNEVLPKASKHQFAAALSFHWNTGAIHRASWVKHHQRGDRAQAMRNFMNWRKPPEIIPRRKAEKRLFFDGVWSNDGTVTEFTRVTHSHRPDWSSAVKVDVTEALRRALVPASV